MAKPARLLVMLCKYFCVHRPRKQSISKEMNIDNDLKFAQHDQIVGLASPLGICCSAFAYMHDKGILHNYIKANNVLLTLKFAHWVLTVIDFGKATFINAKDKYPLFTED